MRPRSTSAGRRDRGGDRSSSASSATPSCPRRRRPAARAGARAVVVGSVELFVVPMRSGCLLRVAGVSRVPPTHGAVSRAPPRTVAGALGVCRPGCLVRRVPRRCWSTSASARGLWARRGARGQVAVTLAALGRARQGRHRLPRAHAHRPPSAGTRHRQRHVLPAHSLRRRPDSWVSRVRDAQPHVRRCFLPLEDRFGELRTRAAPGVTTFEAQGLPGAHGGSRSVRGREGAADRRSSQCRRRSREPGVGVHPDANGAAAAATRRALLAELVDREVLVVSSRCQARHRARRHARSDGTSGRKTAWLGARRRGARRLRTLIAEQGLDALSGARDNILYLTNSGA